MMDALFPKLGDALDQYAAAWPAELGTSQLYRAFLASSSDVFERSHGVGHFTGAAWLISADETRVLLTHHRKLDRRLQLGGRKISEVAQDEAADDSVRRMKRGSGWNKRIGRWASCQETCLKALSLDQIP